MKYLVTHGAKFFNEEIEIRDMSPFFIAIANNMLWAVEFFCDHDADLITPASNGQVPLMWAASRNHDDICMYLSLRVEDVDLINKNTGKNVFRIYLMRRDIERLE